MKLAQANFTYSPTQGNNAWAPEDVDKLEIKSPRDFKKIVNDCRFFYERDPIASTVINKTVEIGITNLIFDKGNLSENEFRVFTGMEDYLQDFAEACALEFLLSGLVIPEIAYTSVGKDVLTSMGVKKYTALTMPTTMFLRDPTTIKINTTFMGKPSYYVMVPEDMIYFIVNKGTYPDGTKDTKKYEELKRDFPEFISQIEQGNYEILLENDLIVTRKVTTKSPYPVPYLYAALEPLKHKRNIRRMDYSIASRVISAIQLFRLGNDEYPVTEEDTSAFEGLKQQMTWRYSAGRDIERIFQLFANHTLQIDWVAPDTAALLDEKKYSEVNKDIFFALGFPRILTTGETERTQTSDPETATMSPEKTMEFMQRKIIKIIKGIVEEVATKNGFKDTPEVRFEKINLKTFSSFIESMRMLYDTGNISRTTLDNMFGLSFEEELRMREEEAKMLEAANLQPFEAQPFTKTPGQEGAPADGKPKPEKKPEPDKPATEKTTTEKTTTERTTTEKPPKNK